jgi:D-glucuronyl C5-epimerase-like protein
LFGRIEIAVVALLLAFAAPASASEVLRVTAGGVVPENDPALPGAAADLQAPPATSCSKPAAPALPPPVPRSAALASSVNRVLRSDYEKGALTAEVYNDYKDIYAKAVSTYRRLSGTRRLNLASVVGSLDRIAHNGSLTVSRMPALFTQLDHNTQFWPSKPLPRIPPPTPSPCRYFAKKSGFVTPVRYVFDDGPLIYEYYPGYGLQLQALANWGKVNALAGACVGVYGPNVPCEPDKLKTYLDAMVSIASKRGNATTWEYWFPFSGGTPPWTSGLSQGTAITALVRGAQVLKDPHYLEVARDAVGIFTTPAPLGVRTSAFGGSWYAEYSFAPRLFILNGFLQALNGIWDLAEATKSAHVRAIYTRGSRAAKHAIHHYDTGAWSLYTLGGNEDDLGYHRLVRDFLKGLCERTKDRVYCHYSNRFTDYLHEHEKLRFLGASGRVGRSLALTFRLSKISCVTVTVKRGGATAFRSRLLMPYGTHSFSWIPRSAGTYTVTFTAYDYLNHLTVDSGKVTVRR